MPFLLSRKNPTATQGPVNLYFTAYVNEFPVDALLDRGSNTTCISENVSKKLKLQFDRKLEVRINQHTSSTKSLGRVRITLKIGKLAKTLNVHVVRGMETELGLNIMGSFQLLPDFSNPLCGTVSTPLGTSFNQQNDNQAHGKHESEIIYLAKEQLRELLAKHSGIFFTSQTNLEITNAQEIRNNHY